MRHYVITSDGKKDGSHLKNPFFAYAYSPETKGQLTGNLVGSIVATCTLLDVILNMLFVLTLILKLTTLDTSSKFHSLIKVLNS